MLDAFKTMTGGKNKLVQKQTDELELLIATAREERSAISAMLTALTTRSAKLAPLGKTLEQVSEKAAGVTSRLDEIAKRLTALDDRTKELEELDKRIQALKDSATQAEQTTQKALGPGRRAAEASRGGAASVVAGARTQATLDTLKKERAALEELRVQLQKSETEVKQSLGQSSSLKAELDQIRAVAATLTQDYGKIRETSREAREDTTAALTTVKEVENKLGPLAQLHELSQSTEERLTALNALAEHVSHKAKALETPAAGGRARRRPGQPRQRDGLGDGRADRQAERGHEAGRAKADDTLGAHREADRRDQRRSSRRPPSCSVETERETAKLKKEAGVAARRRPRPGRTRSALKKKEFEAFDERLRTLHSGVGDAESRMEALAAKDKNLIELDPEGRRPDQALRGAVRVRPTT